MTCKIMEREENEKEQRKTVHAGRGQQPIWEMSVDDLTDANSTDLTNLGIEKTTANLAYTFNGKGLLYADYKVGNLSFLVEGGYQWMEYWSTVQNSNNATETMKGPFARIGVGYAF